MPPNPVPAHAIVLAGGRGARLQHITTALGEPKEKQFCRFGSGRSLLQRTVERLAPLESIDRVSVIVRADQRELAREQLHRYPEVSLIAQPADRGTGAALMTALLPEVRRRSLTVLSPCDQAFADETLFAETLSVSIARASNHHEPILIGAEPDRPRSDYGWIVPEPGDPSGAPRVSRFVEKPDLETAAALMEQGALFNTMLMVAPTEVLLSTFDKTAPEMFRELLPAALLDGEERDHYLEWAFRRIDPVDFSAHVVARIPGLRVIELPVDAGWTDLGDADRLIEWLEACRSPQLESVRRARI